MIKQIENIVNTEACEEQVNSFMVNSENVQLETISREESNENEIALRDYNQGKIKNLEDIVRTLQRCKENSRNDYSRLSKIFRIDE